MTVVFAGQCIVANKRRRIFSLLHGTQNGQVNREGLALPAHLVQQGLYGKPVCTGRQLMPQNGQEPPQAARCQMAGFVVDTPQVGYVVRGQEPGDSLIGLHHEHLDDLVRKTRIRPLDVDHVPILVAHKLNLGQIQLQHAFAQTPETNRSCQSLHVSKKCDHLGTCPARLAIQHRGR